MGSFLAYKLSLPDEIRKALKNVDLHLTYDGRYAKHKIPHVTIKSPRKTFDIEDWKEVASKQPKPNYFKPTKFSKLWNSSKLGYFGEFDVDVNINKPHVTLIDTGFEDITNNCWREYVGTFEKFYYKKIPVESIALINENGIIFENHV